MFVPGATTLGVVCSNGVILASEKRVSYGYLVVSRVGKKVLKITNRIGAACAGLVSDMQVLIRDVEAYATSVGDEKYNIACDLDGDSDVDMFDFAIFAANYGKTA